MPDRPHAELFEDEDHAGDPHDMMTSIVTRRPAAGARKGGDVLRSRVVSLRRRVGFDRDDILPLCCGVCG